MGASAIVPVVNEKLLPELYKSMSRSLEESETGKVVLDTLRNKLEPLFGKHLEQELGALKATGTKPTIDQIFNATNNAKQSSQAAVLGTKKQFITASIESMYREKGIAAAHNLASIYDVYNKDAASAHRQTIRAIGKKAGIPELENFKLGSSYSRDYIKSEQWARKAMSPFFLARISIPHFTQASNNLLTVGWKATVDAIKDFSKEGSANMYEFAVRSGALSSELEYEMLRTAQGTSKWMKVVDPLRKTFLFERKWQLVMSSVAGKHGAMEAADRLVASNGTNKAAEIQLKLLGLNPADVLKQGGQLTDDQISTAAFRNAQETMFIRSPLQTPKIWQSNVAMRTAWMYKDYGYNQAKLIKDTLVRAKTAEGYVGVAKKMATIGSVFFAAGEFVKAAEGVVTLENPYSKESQKKQVFENEYLDALAHFGGFGIYYSMLRSATKSGLSNFIEGPLISTGAEIGNELLRGARQILNDRMPVNEARAFARSIGGRAGLLGRPITNVVIPPKKHYSKDPRI